MVKKAPGIAQDPALEALAALAGELDGELRLDPLHRLLYATDASLYAEQPLGVAYPKHTQDVAKIVRCCAAHKIPLIPRTAGTSLAGQCVGSGLVLDTSKHMRNILEVNEAERWVRVQPGVILDELNHILKPTGLMFGPDTSTSNRCMIGGMIGNNSCGSHSILYGNTMAHTLEVSVILADGSEAHLSAMSPADLDAACQRPDTLAPILRTLRDTISTHRPEILARYPKPSLTRRNMAYPLDDLATSEVFDPTSKKPFNLARFLCGTEGTLAITTEAKLNLVPRPRAISVLASHFHSIDESLRATVVAVHNNPAAVELIDKRTLDASADNLEQQRNRAWLEGDPGAVLIIEFYRDSPADAEAAALATAAQFNAEGWGYAHKLLSPAQTNMAWELRKAGLGALMGIAGDVKPITFVEDTAVAVEDLPNYIRDFAQIMAHHQTECVYYAHASVGELHLRPELNPKDPADIAKMKAIAADVADLVRRYQGTISGEHGDGRVRSPFIRHVLGDEVVAALSAVKAAFDPLNILNPHKILDPAPIDADLRYPPGRPVPTIPTFFSFPEDDGLLRAVERCNGAGACRKLVFSGGTMCPSYMVTRDEKHTTRGRANSFRMLLLGAHHPEQMWGSPEVYEAMDLCLGCKGCKSECPASVDMAKLKAEFLQHYYDVHGTPRRAQLFGDPLSGYKLAQSLAKLTNPSLKTPLAKQAMKALFGIHPKRDLPAFAPQTLRQHIAKHPPSAASAPNGDVVLYIDMFTDYHDPHLGVAAIDLLQMAGYRVLTPPHPYSGRTQISKGLLRKARALAVANVHALLPFATRNTPILGIEPSEILTLIDELPELVPDDLRPAALQIASKVSLVDNFIAARAKSDQLNGLSFRDPSPSSQGPKRALVHGHCHQKALVGLNPTLDALRLIDGWKVETIPSGCCGMAGSFGYEEEHYDISMATGELVLFPALRAAPDAIVIAPGTSCRHQIHDGTQRPSLHPIEALRLTASPR